MTEIFIEDDYLRSTKKKHVHLAGLKKPRTRISQIFATFYILMRIAKQIGLSSQKYD